MPSPKSLEDLMAVTGLDEQRLKSVMFHITDYLIDNVDKSDDVIDCGMYHNHQHNGMANMLESFKALTWAMYEEIDGTRPEVPGPWVHIGTNGIFLSRDRVPTLVVENGIAVMQLEGFGDDS